jgi:hypothetical protein
LRHLHTGELHPRLIGAVPTRRVQRRFDDVRAQQRDARIRVRMPIEQPISKPAV